MKIWILFFGICFSMGQLLAQDCEVGTVSVDQTICPGDTPGQLSIDNYLEDSDLQWEVSVDNSVYDVITGATGSTYLPESLSETTYYRVEVSEGTSGTGCTTAYSAVITITVATPPEPPTAITGTTTICSGSSTTLTAFGGDNGSGAVYEWGIGSVGDNIIAGEVAAEYITDNLTSSTTYWVRKKGNNCEQPTAGVTQLITVQTNPTAPTGITADPEAICNGGSAILLATGGDDGSGAVFQWGTGSVVGAGDPIAGTLNTITISPQATTTYWVRRKGNTECQEETGGVTIEVVVDNPPTAPTSILVDDEIVCNGTSVTLTADGGDDGSNSEYEWGTGTIGYNIISGATSAVYNSGSLTADTKYWVRRKGTSVACNQSTNAVEMQIQVLPVPSVSIGELSELCQLSGQLVIIENTTLPHPSLEPVMNVNWQMVPGSPGAIEGLSSGNSHELLLNLESASPGSASFGITSIYFQDYSCSISTGLPTESFTVKARPSAAIGPIQDEDITGNSLCQGYGPVSINIETLPVSQNILWEASYLDPDLTNIDVGSVASFNLDNSITGSHVVTIHNIAYDDGLACEFNPADFGNQYNYTSTVEIKATPPAVEFIDGAPAILQFCNYATPLVVDSVAKVSDLNSWVVNESGYNIKWKSSNDNSAVNLNEIPLNDGGAYYPVFELDGCHSMLNSSSLSFIVNLMPLPNMQLSNLEFPESICSGTPFDILFNPSDNISHFSISDFNFDPPLSSPNITSASSYPNIPGSNFFISNSSDTDDTWAANVYAQNKNVSEINPVICWAQPLPIEILVNPNATFNPPVTNFESCQNGSGFTIDPGWNGVGDVDWDDPLGFPASVAIDGSTKIISVDMNAQLVPPGVYPIHISGGYPGSGCEVDANFTISIYATPEFETRILDIDGTICHNEYTHIEVIDPKTEYVYQWSCTGCESDPHEGSYFLPHWSNPEPMNGAWNDLPATYSVTAIDLSTNEHCANLKSTNVNILADYASCPEGIDFFLPNALSVVDDPALYFQWYDVESAGVFSAISGATDQTFFPNDDIQGCDTSKYIVATSLYSDRCWSTTINCFEEFGLRFCNGPKSKTNLPKFLLYPNPVVGNDVILENLSNDLQGRYAIEVIDITGKRLMSDIIEIEMVGRVRIVLPSVDPGVYLLRISNTAHTETFKIIIN